MTKKAQQPEAIQTEGPKIEKIVTFMGKRYAFILHMITYTYPAYSFNLINRVTDREGRDVTGSWKYGTYGRNHIESLEFDPREGANYLQFITVCHWCNGRQKNGRKYLSAILYKDDNREVRPL